MSHEAVTWSMERAPMLRTARGKADTTARGVLHTLAEFARPDGTEARPSVLRLVYRSGFDARTVRRALRRLTDAGLIRETGTAYGCTVYALDMTQERPACDWEELKAEEERERAAAADRQRRSRARRVTHSGDVTEEDVTESASGRHALEPRDVTHFASGRHALNAPLSVNEPPAYPPVTPTGGRRPTTGSGGEGDGGSAARQDKAPAEGIAAADVRAVITALPLHLRKQLERVCQTVPDAITDTIRRELKNGLTVDQLITRIARRWAEQRFEDDALSATGRGLERPVGVAQALIRHGNCPHPLCDDGNDLATDADCRTCERTCEDRRPAPQEPVQGAFPVVVPSARPEPAQAPGKRLVPHNCADRMCPNSYPAPQGAPAGLCPECRTSAREASNA